MEQVFVPLRTASRSLGLPAAWLKRQAIAGVIPHTRAGRRVFVNVEQVAETLLVAGRSAAAPKTPDAEGARDE